MIYLILTLILFGVVTHKKLLVVKNTWLAFGFAVMTMGNLILVFLGLAASLALVDPVTHGVPVSPILNVVGGVFGTVYCWTELRMLPEKEKRVG